MAKPFLKWPGGKRWLAPLLAPILRSELGGIYYEPFFGAGAVFYELSPIASRISDSNVELISTLRTIRRHPVEVIEAVQRCSNNEKFYYKMRSRIPRTDIGRAARFVYLNRTCWAGLHRLNRDGQFNVPFGNSGRTIISKAEVISATEVLQRAELDSCDFEKIISQTMSGDVLYADPPYTTRGENNGFVRYNEKLFSWRDQVRLSKCCWAARSRGVFVAVSGLCHVDVLGLYAGWWMLKLARTSLVGRDPTSRGEVHEVVLFSRRPVHDQNLALRRVLKR